MIKGKNLSRTKVKGTSLFYAIVLSLLIGLIMIALMSLNFYHAMEIEAHDSTVRLIRNCNSAESILLSEASVKEAEEWHQIYELEDSTFFMHKPMGLWNIGLVKARIRREEISREFVFGSKWKDDGVALKLKNGISGLSVSGRNIIRGDVQVPGGRVKPAFIEGQSFSGERLVYGGVSEVPRAFPKISPMVAERIEALTRVNQADSVVNFNLTEDKIQNTFKNKTLVLFSEDSMSVLQKSIEGNVMIKSNRAIYISPFASLDNVIVQAPRIYIGSGFKGRAQLFAVEKIHVGEEVNLKYPSAVCVMGEENTETDVQLFDNCSIEGVVLSLNNGNRQVKRKTKFHRGSTVVGQVYCEGSLELRGRVGGQIVTREFSLRTPSASYKNHLLGAEIDVTKLPSWFSGVHMKNEKRVNTKLLDI